MKRAIAPLLIAAIAVSALAQDSVTLRYNLKQGKVYRYSMQMGMSMEGGPVAMDIKMNMISCLKVKEIVDGFINTVNYFDFFKVSTSQPGMEQMVGGQEAEIKKLRITQQFDFLGTPKGQPSVSGGAMANQLGMVNGLTGNSSLGLAFPKDPVTVGKTWEQSIDMGKAMGAAMGGGDIKDPLKLTYTVKSFGEFKGRKAVTIALVMKANIGMPVPGGEGAEAPKIEMAIDGSGEIVVDQLTGMTLKSDTLVGIGISMKGMPAGAPEQMKQKMKVKSELIAPNSL